MGVLGDLCRRLLATHDIPKVIGAGVQAVVRRERTSGPFFHPVALGVFSALERGREGKGAGVAGEAEECEGGFCGGE